MDDDLAARLLGSIETGRLVVFAGAGLSIPAPSSVPTAAQLVTSCVPRYEQIIAPAVLPGPARVDLEELARYARTQGQLGNLLIRRLIPKRSFFRHPNDGHYAIADFLACGALFCSVTTNVDVLVERAANNLGEDAFEAALNGAEAGVVREHRTYLKIHGCFQRDIDNTIWCREQLGDAPIDARIASSTIWLRANLTGRDLVFVGFWSDWSYLNDILEQCLQTVTPATVVLVAPVPAADLEQKAPNLWALAHAHGVHFHHEPVSGVDFLDELRRRFSTNLLRRMLTDAVPTYTALTGNANPNPATSPLPSTTKDLYAFRRNLSGVAEEYVTRHRQHDPSMMEFGAIHFLLLVNGATLSGSMYVLNGITIRLLQTASQAISLVTSKFANDTQPNTPQYMVICVGAINDVNVAVNVVRAPSAPTIVRFGAGGVWLTTAEARTELGI